MRNRGARGASAGRSLGACGCLLGLSQLARAADGDAAAASFSAAPIVAWEAPPECPDAQTVGQRISSLDDRPGDGWRNRGEVRGRIRATASGAWELALTISQRSADGNVAASERVLGAPHCDDLAEAAAVAIIIALGDGADGEPNTANEGAALSAGRVTLGAGPATLGAAPPLEDASPRAEHPAAGSGGLGFDLVPSAGAVLDSASLGSAAFGATAQAQLRSRLFALGVYGVWLPPHETALGARQDVAFSLLAAGARGCYLAGSQRLSVDVCAAFELGSLGAEGEGLVAARTRQDAWLAPVWGAGLGWQVVGGLRLEARLEALLPLGKQRYVVDGDVLVHAVPESSIRAGLGLGWALGGASGGAAASTD